MIHADLISWIHTAVNTDLERALVSAALVGLLAIVASAAYALGPRLERWLDEEAIEALQSVVVTITGIVVAAFLVVTWELSQGDQVGSALRDVTPSTEDGVKVMFILLVFAAAFTITRVTKRFVKEGAERDAISSHQQEVLHHVVQIVIFAPAVLFAFALWQTNPGDLLFGAGVLGIVLGLAARQTLGAVLAGFVVLFSRPFEVGDWVVIDDREGIVTDVTIVNTRIRTFDNEQAMIPNDTVTASEVVNRSRNGRLRIQVDVGVDYNADVKRAVGVALDAMDTVEEILDYPEPDVAVDRFGDSQVVLNLRFWISDPSISRKWDAQNAVMSAVKDAFEAEGIKIPFPQRELTGRSETEGLRVRTTTGTTTESDPHSDVPGTPTTDSDQSEDPTDASPAIDEEDD